MQNSAGDIASRLFVHVLGPDQLGHPCHGDLRPCHRLIEHNASRALPLKRVVYHDSIAHTGTSPSPADYDQPQLVLWLNREHPIVRAGQANEP